ncbi:hypothetical protein BJF85_02190 [Saccharomonospora sp. CUA-673]|uniref:Imm1 family immunity protein n=1 Tax=Saccharomonospora sp. CUA-673 TaxID=1904969 RepID=UPI000964A921|nr:Imm1 family immunity protein [Saccharomonospora sp. CUA-673]OLT45216.1 hypothetical protein BJF85_02190 [Saccharomonospora sp. CUA-673]
MKLVAAVPTFRDGVAGGESLTLATDDDVARLVKLLSRDDADTANIQGTDVTLSAHVAHGYGYLLYAGPDGYVVSDGDPTSPAVESESGFPAQSGIALDRFAEALRQFVRTGRLPESISWRDL